MKSLPKEKMNTAILMTVIAVVFTILVGTVDRQPVGVEGTKIYYFLQKSKWAQKSAYSSAKNYTK